LSIVCYGKEIKCVQKHKKLLKNERKSNDCLLREKNNTLVKNTQSKTILKF